MERVAIIGSGGAGKSTLARALGARLNLPVYHLDQVFWQPGWKALPRAEWIEQHDALCAKPRWILDGNYGSTMDHRLACCDAVVFLDISRWRCMYRVLRRRLRYAGRTRPDMSPDCPERVPWDFVQWILAYPHTRRPAILQKLNVLRDEKAIYHVQSPSEVNHFLEQWAQRVSR